MKRGKNWNFWPKYLPFELQDKLDAKVSYFSIRFIMQISKICNFSIQLGKDLNIRTVNDIVSDVDADADNLTDNYMSTHQF